MKYDMLLDAMEYLDDDLVAEADFSVRRKRKGLKRRLLSLSLAAVLTAGLAISAGAAVRESELDLMVLNYMGLGSHNTSQLMNGMIEMDAFDSEVSTNQLSGSTDTVTMKAVSSIGDNRTACIRINCDAILPDDFNPESDYLMFSDGPVILKNKKTALCGSMTEALYDEESGQSYFMLSIYDLKDINRSNLSVILSDLMIYHDKNDPGSTIPPETLYEGSWQLDWKYSYRTNVNNKKVRVTVNEGKSTITAIQISPLGIRLSGKGSEDLSVDSVSFKDGTILTDLDYSVSSHKNVNGKESFSYYICFEIFNMILDPENIDSITVNGITISL